MRVRDSSVTLIRPFDTHYNLSNDNNEQTKAHFFAKVLYTCLENKPFSSQYNLLPRCNASYSGTRYCFAHWLFDRPERSLGKRSISSVPMRWAKPKELKRWVWVANRTPFKLQLWLWFEDTSGEVKCYLSRLRCVEKYTEAVARGKEWFKFLIYGTCTQNARRTALMPCRLLLWLSLAGEYRNNITVATVLQLSCYLGCYNEPSCGRPYYKRTADQIAI